MVIESVKVMDLILSEEVLELEGVWEFGGVGIMELGGEFGVVLGVV